MGSARPSQIICTRMKWSLQEAEQGITPVVLTVVLVPQVTTSLPARLRPSLGLTMLALQGEAQPRTSSGRCLITDYYHRSDSKVCIYPMLDPQHTPIGNVELPLTMETPPQPTSLLTYICVSFLLTVNIRESSGPPGASQRKVG